MTTPTTPPASVAVPRVDDDGGTLAPFDIQALIRTAIVHNASIDTLERLLALAERVQADAARRAWYAAVAEFQRRCPTIVKSSTARIATRSGPGFAYTYAPLNAIMGLIGHVLGDCELSVSWVARVEPTAVVVRCRLAHAAGHVEDSGELTIPIPASGESGASGPQRVGIAMTYAKRYALLGVLGLAPEEDDDAAADLPAQKAPEGGTLQYGEYAASSPAAEAWNRAQEKYRADEQEKTRRPPEDPDAVISKVQLDRLRAIGKSQGWTPEQGHDLLTSYRYNRLEEITAGHYEAIVNTLKQGPPKK